MSNVRFGEAAAAKMSIITFNFIIIFYKFCSLSPRKAKWTGAYMHSKHLSNV